MSGAFNMIGDTTTEQGGVEVLHTSQLSEATLAAIRTLLDEAYDDFSDEDWEHTIGGMHALAWDGAELVGHGSVVQRRMLHTPREGQAQALRAGYVEGVAVRADHRRRGIGKAIMSALKTVIRRSYAIGALSAADEARSLYAAGGWQPWQGRTFAMTPAGITRTEEEDEGIFVLAVEPIDLAGDLTCDWRDGDVW